MPDAPPIHDGLFEIRDGRPVLRGGFSAASGHRHFPLRPVCPFSGADDVVEVELPGEGSLLWWTFILAVCNALVLVQNRTRNLDQMPFVIASILSVGAFFLSLLVFITDPFERLPFTPVEGSDLNPLLQNY